MEKYKQYLRSRGLSDKTVDAYVRVAAFFLDKYSEVSVETLTEYRAWLAENFEPSTAEQRVRLINSYVAFLGFDERAARLQAFRNLFAQCFLSAGGDGSLLDVLMGNAVAEEGVWDDPERIRKVVDRLVTW